MIDDDYLDEHEELKKNDRRDAKIGMTAIGAMTGGMLGGLHGTGKGLAAGVAVGAGLGYLGGRHMGKKSDAKYDKQRKLYERADEETKAYLRRKREKELDRRNAMNAAISAGYLAGR